MRSVPILSPRSRTGSSSRNCYHIRVANQLSVGFVWILAQGSPGSPLTISDDAVQPLVTRTVIHDTKSYILSIYLCSVDYVFELDDDCFETCQTHYTMSAALRIYRGPRMVVWLNQIVGQKGSHNLECTDHKARQMRFRSPTHKDNV